MEAWIQRERNRKFQDLKTPLLFFLMFLGHLSVSLTLTMSSTLLSASYKTHLRSHHSLNTAIYTFKATL